jgi:hypothetical protein
MSSDRLAVSVTFDARRGYVASASELRAPVTALSLGGLRRRLEALLLPDDVDVKLHLDRAARQERDRRRPQAQLSRIAQLDQRTTLPNQCLHSAEADVRRQESWSGYHFAVTHETAAWINDVISYRLRIYAGAAHPATRCRTMQGRPSVSLSTGGRRRIESVALKHRSGFRRLQIFEQLR